MTETDLTDLTDYSQSRGGNSHRAKSGTTAEINQLNQGNQSGLPLALPATATFAEWSSLGATLCAGARAMNWLIGDWLIAGVEQHGQKARDEANRIFRTDAERFNPNGHAS